MPKKVMFSLLDRASNGDELLQILDSFADESSEVSNNEPTTDPIDFW